MWPWGHLAFGYIFYSLGRRGLVGGRVGGLEVIVLAVATQLPDLIDKPLAWALAVFPSGYSVAHSAFVAIPVGVAALAVAVSRDRLGFGLAFTVGYWSHLLGDILAGMALNAGYSVSRVLWPLVTLPGSHTELGSVDQVVYYAAAFLELLQTAQNPLVVVVYLGPLLTAGILWLVDGAPVLRELREWAIGLQ